METLLKSFKDVFAWEYTDLLGIDSKFYQHKINLKKDAVPVWQQWYRMNSNYAWRVKEELDRLLKVGFIYPVDRATWLSPIVIVPKKNMKLRVYVDYRKLNVATITDPFPLLLTIQCWIPWWAMRCIPFWMVLAGIIRCRWHQRIERKQLSSRSGWHLSSW